MNGRSRCMRRVRGLAGCPVQLILGRLRGIGWLDVVRVCGLGLRRLGRGRGIGGRIAR